jgi:hypothetical protein
VKWWSKRPDRRNLNGHITSNGKREDSEMASSTGYGKACVVSFK